MQRIGRKLILDFGTGTYIEIVKLGARPSELLEGKKAVLCDIYDNGLPGEFHCQETRAIGLPVGFIFGRDVNWYTEIDENWLTEEEAEMIARSRKVG